MPTNFSADILGNDNDDDLNFKAIYYQVKSKKKNASSSLTKTLPWIFTHLPLPPEKPPKKILLQIFGRMCKVKVTFTPSRDANFCLILTEALSGKPICRTITRNRQLMVVDISWVQLYLQTKPTPSKEHFVR